MNSILSKIKLILRSEIRLARIQIRRAFRSALLVFVSLFFMGVTWVMLNVSCYFFLRESYSQTESALYVALINFVLALVPLLLIIFEGKTTEECVAIEIKDLAKQELELKIDTIKQSAENSIREAESSIRSVKRGGFLLKLLASAFSSRRKPRKNRK